MGDLIGVSLFTGAGGLDLGLEAAGFRPSICVERNAAARDTLRANRPGWKLSETLDIHDMSPDDLMAEAGLETREVAILSAGPPCQPFSKAAEWARDGGSPLDDPRAATLGALLDVVEAAQPQVIFFENVAGFLSRGARTGLDDLRQGLQGVNRRTGTRYELDVAVLDAADYGVPQHRRRTVGIADRDGRPWRPPPKTHGPDAASGQRYITAWDAIGELEEVGGEKLAVGGKWGGLLPTIPEGQNYLWHTDRCGGRPLFGWRTRYWSFLLKLEKARPSWTILASPGTATGPFHWESRKLSTQELGRLQSFPTSYTISGGYIAARRQIGNAVPPLLAEVLAADLAATHFDVPNVEPRTLAIGTRSDCPSPDPVKRVPRRYLRRVGRHAPHPGTGLGPGGRDVPD